MALCELAPPNELVAELEPAKDPVAELEPAKDPVAELEPANELVAGVQSRTEPSRSAPSGPGAGAKGDGLGVRDAALGAAALPPLGCGEGGGVGPLAAAAWGVAGPTVAVVGGCELADAGVHGVLVAELEGLLHELCGAGDVHRLAGEADEEDTAARGVDSSMVVHPAVWRWLVVCPDEG